MPDAAATPEDLPVHVQYARDYFQVHANDFCQPQCPEIHINEFSAGEHDAIPGWALGWIYCLERANVDWSSKACWQVAASSQSACGHGLAGLFAADGRTPQHTYWVYRAYGQLPPRRVRTKIANPRTVALAARNDAAHELRILVGRYSCGKKQRWCLFSDRYVGDEPNAPAHVEIKVPAFPYRARVVQVHAQRIPNQGIPGPLAAPQSLPVWNVNVKQGRVTVKLDVVGDGDVYLLTLRPQNLLSDRRAKPSIFSRVHEKNLK